MNDTNEEAEHVATPKEIDAHVDRALELYESVPDDVCLRAGIECLETERDALLKRVRQDPAQYSYEDEKDVSQAESLDHCITWMRTALSAGTENV